MQDSERDETIERVRAALRPLPKADAHAVARVLSAVHGRTPQPTPRWREFLEWVRMPSLSRATAGGLAVAALFVGYMLSDNQTAPSLRGPNSAAPSVAVAESTPPSIQANATGGVPTVVASSADDAVRLIPWQFVLELPNATSVSVVGDFNDWNVGQAPMQRFADGAWSITIPMKPGRHEYSFVVDGRKWMADPRATKASDTDFGKPGSVIMINTP